MSDWNVRRARKPHHCTFCEGAILVASEYAYVRSTPWDHPDNDGFTSLRAHPFCLEMWNRFIGPGWDWELPPDTGEWTDAVRYFAPERAAEYPFTTTEAADAE